MGNKYFIIDFDSTFTKVEALDELADIVLEGLPERTNVQSKIKDLTDRAMEGRLSFHSSLHRRLRLLRVHRWHIRKLIRRLRGKVSESFSRNRHFFDKYRDQIIILSSGFKEFIVPIVEEFGIKSENVYANTFVFDEKGWIKGVDETNVLSTDQGKVKQLQSLNLDGEIYVIGDGHTDYELREAGLAHKFYAFTENVVRASVLKKADHVTSSLDDFLKLQNLHGTSKGAGTLKVLLLESIHPNGVEIFKKRGYDVEILPAGLTETELMHKISDVSILGIRSKTPITRKVLKKANKLIAIGAFCIGTNQIDLEACLEKGIAVFNAPFSNTRSVVELTIAHMIYLVRNITDKISAMHEGQWRKSAQHSHEIRGKKLGIVGYGNIGSQLSVMAESVGLDVYFYDIDERLPLGNATKCESLEDLLHISDIVTIHVDGRPENTNLIGTEEFEIMRDGVIFLNQSRGHVVDIDALSRNLKSGKVGGAAIDVFPLEPISNDDIFISALQHLPNTILTPHVGGSTEEAQEHIAEFVPNKIIDYLVTGATTLSVNFPNLQLPSLRDAHRFIHIHRNTPGVLAQINQILARYKINVVGEYLKTNEAIGYVITDIDKNYSPDAIDDLRSVDSTIRFRVLY